MKDTYLTRQAVQLPVEKAKRHQTQTKSSTTIEDFVMLLSAQLQKASNPLRVFYQKLFDGQLISMDRSARKAALTLADVSAMPRQTQLLIGHLLQRNESELMLLDDDTDVCALLNAGWLISMPLSPPGFNIFKFKPQCWSQLRSLIPRFLNDALLSELVNYRRHKTAAYPWVW